MKVVVVPGIRAAVCHDIYSAHQGVEHDDSHERVARPDKHARLNGQADIIYLACRHDTKRTSISRDLTAISLQ